MAEDVTDRDVIDKLRKVGWHLCCEAVCKIVRAYSLRMYKALGMAWLTQIQLDDDHMKVPKGTGYLAEVS